MDISAYNDLLIEADCDIEKIIEWYVEIFEVVKKFQDASKGQVSFMQYSRQAKVYLKGGKNKGERVNYPRGELRITKEAFRDAFNMVYPTPTEKAMRRYVGALRDMGLVTTDRRGSLWQEPARDGNYYCCYRLSALMLSKQFIDRKRQRERIKGRR